MKRTTHIIIFAIALFAFMASAHAQSPREQLSQMVEQLQKTPTDNTLREKIIKLAQDMKPAPAIPEEANRAFVKGNVFQKEAKDASGFELAISAYRDALRVAPWWSDAYYNLAVALESARKFDQAIAATRLYMASLPVGGAEAREAQNRIYALEAKSEMASRQATAAVQQAAILRFEGNWYKIVRTYDGPYRQSFTVVRDPNGNWIMSGSMFPEPAYDVRLEGGALKFKDSVNRLFGDVEYSGSLSPDASRLRFDFRVLPPTPAQERNRREHDNMPNDRFGGEEWLRE